MQDLVEITEPVRNEIQHGHSNDVSKLTRKQALFVHYYWKFDQDHKAAITAAGYTGDPRVVWNKLRDQPKIMEMILMEAKRVREANRCNAEWCVKQLMEEATKEGEGATHSARVAALDKLARATGAYDRRTGDDNTHVSINMDFGDNDILNDGR